MRAKVNQPTSEKRIMATTDERRKFSRVTTYLPVRLRVERSGRYLETLARDVSVGGLRCLVEGLPLVDDPLQLELPLYKEILPLSVQGTVAWVQPSAANAQSVVGVNFSALSPSERHVLTDYLDHLPASTVALAG